MNELDFFSVERSLHILTDFSLPYNLHGSLNNRDCKPILLLVYRLFSHPNLQIINSERRERYIIRGTLTWSRVQLKIIRSGRPIHRNGYLHCKVTNEKAWQRYYGRYSSRIRLGLIWKPEKTHSCIPKLRHTPIVTSVNIRSPRTLVEYLKVPRVCVSK